MSAIRDRLRAAGIDAYDGEPTTTPAGLYVVVSPDPGRDTRHALAGNPRVRAESSQVRIVAKTVDGVLAHTEKVRAALTTPTTRVAGSLPVYPDGPDSDRRLNSVLILSTHR